QRFAFLKYLWSAGDLMEEIIKAEDPDKIMENAIKVSPIPRIFYKGTKPWHDEKEYVSDDLIDNYIKSSGPKQAVKDLKEENKEKVRKQLEAKGYSGEELEKKVKSELRKINVTKS